MPSETPPRPPSEQPSAAPPDPSARPLPQTPQEAAEYAAAAREPSKALFDRMRERRQKAAEEAKQKKEAKKKQQQSTEEDARGFSAKELAEMTRTSRLGIPDFVRFPAAALAAFATGMSLGMIHGSKMAGLRFRAEHAHKLPTSQKGWYLYHRSKNYHMALGAGKEGVKMGAKISVWTTALFAVETVLDNFRGSTDFVNTVLASVAVSGAFSLWNRFPLIMAARTTKTAIKVGLAYGGLQDLVGYWRGRPIGYIDWMKRKYGKKEKPAENTSEEKAKPEEAKKKQEPKLSEGGSPEEKPSR